MQPDVSIVIVSWNVRDLLRDCLDSILVDEGLAKEIIVVDSLSSDGSPDMVRQSFPTVRLIEPGENVGFSKGNNLGIQASSGRFVFILNPDTKVLERATSRLVAYLDSHPTVGVAGPQLLNDDMTVQSSRRRFPTLGTAFFESTWLQPYALRHILDRYHMRDCSDEETLSVDWLQGAALMVRREVIQQVGGFDEAFFMYSEELDWQRRIKDGAWEIVYYPEARIIHYGGKSSEQSVASRDIHFHSSKIRYFRKYHGPVVAGVLRVFLLLNYVWQIGLEGAKWMIGHKRDLRRARVRAYWQVLQSGLRG